MDLVLDEQPAAGTAALALVEEQAEVRAFDGGVEVGVGEDDVGALAAQFQADALEVALGGRLMMIWPVVCSPVKATLSTSMWLVRAAPAVGP